MPGCSDVLLRHPIGKSWIKKNPNKNVNGGRILIPYRNIILGISNNIDV